MTERNGVLPVDKPEGPTSHDVVAQARRGLGTRRVGHTGTLDPFASGLLLICVGGATRLSEYLTALRKRYVATMRLGVATDTDDLTGTPIFESDAWRSLDEEAVRAALEAQVGDRLQLPPRYSAKKVAGERLYASARRGEEVERTPTPVTIHSIRVLRIELPEVEFEVECGSGTYIRAIARDAGESLGVGGSLTRLRRTSVGDFDLGQAVALDQLSDASAVDAAILSPARAVAHLAHIEADEAGVRALGYGQGIPATGDLPVGVPIAILSGPDQLVAIGERVGDRIQPRKVLA
jgi:tRNA pseudouridine55 synthase